MFLGAPISPVLINVCLSSIEGAANQCSVWDVLCCFICNIKLRSIRQHTILGYRFCGGEIVPQIFARYACPLVFQTRGPSAPRKLQTSSVAPLLRYLLRQVPEALYTLKYSDTPALPFSSQPMGEIHSARRVWEAFALFYLQPLLLTHPGKAEYTPSPLSASFTVFLQ